MEQPTPYVSRKNVECIVRRDFQPSEYKTVLKILSKFDQDGNQNPRVQLAILKLADRDINKIQYFTDLAAIDQRDVLAPAEYPEYSKYSEISLLTPEKRDSIIKQDWDQYNNWLGRYK